MNSIKAVLLALLAAFVLKLFFFDLMIARGNSMEPAIKSGSVLVINRLRYGFRFPWQHDYLINWARPEAGEVVVFFTSNGELAVKRCTSSDGKGFFAEGDNPVSSYDSRSYGLVPNNNIIGKVLGY
ncbi:MAG: signal peptidase I [Treponema sp.]|jgi:signal peptidase I|nr:signal peptidase I [Treponema sp.]